MAFRLDSLPIGYWYRWEIRLGCDRGQAAILSQALLQLPVSNWPRNAKWRGILLDCSRTCLYSSFAILISSCNSINLCAYTQSLWMSAALCFDSPCPRMEREIVVMYPFRAVSGPRESIDEMLDIFRSSYDVGDKGFNSSWNLSISSSIILSEYLGPLLSSTLFDVSTTQSTNLPILCLSKCFKTHHTPLYSTRLAAFGVDRVVGIDMEVCSNWVRLVIYSIDVEVIVNS